MRRVDSLEKTLMLGGTGGRRRRGRQGCDGWMVSLTRGTWVWVNSGSCWWTGRPGVLWFMGLQRVRHDWVTELNWTLKKKNRVCLSEIQIEPRSYSLPDSLRENSLSFIGFNQSWLHILKKKEDSQYEFLLSTNGKTLYCFSHIRSCVWTDEV